VCGRFTLTADLEILRRIFLFAQQADLTYNRRYNIAPGQKVLVVTEGTGQRRVATMRWGLIPGWAREERIGYKLINARAETIDQKPSFRKAFLERRCLIPADGFFEWKRAGREKYPFRIILPDKPVFAFAGVWEQWRSPEGKSITSCCIITTEANAFMQRIHQRMPAILAEAEEQAIWLKPQRPDAADTLRKLLQPYGGPMEAYRVSKVVNSPRVDTPECIARLDRTNYDQ
jgi:putative SOS response-associated peptidase YedK